MKLGRMSVLVLFVVSLLFTSIALADETNSSAGSAQAQQSVSFEVKGSINAIDAKGNTLTVKVQTFSDSLKPYTAKDKDLIIQVDKKTKFFTGKEEKKNGQTLIIHEKEIKFVDLKKNDTVIVKGTIFIKGTQTNFVANEVNKI